MRSSFLVAIVFVAALSSACTASARKPAAEGQQPRLFVAPTGSDSGSCSSSSPCASLNRAYTLAHAGDLIQVASGSYPGQTVLSDARKGPARVTFKALPGVSIAAPGLILGQNNGSASGNAPSHVVFDGFDVNGSFVIWSMNGVPPYSTDITLKNSHVHAFAHSGPLVNIGTSVSNVNILNDEVGPACCDSDAITIGKGPNGPNTSAVTISGTYVHDIRDSCTNWGAPLAGCSGTGFGDGRAAGCYPGCDHIDGFQASGVDGLTISNSRFYDAGTQNIFLGPCCGGTFSNILLENNMVAASDTNRRGNSVSISGPGTNILSGFVTLLNNTIQSNATIYDSTGNHILTPGTKVTVEGNIIRFWSHCDLVTGDGGTDRPTYDHNLFGTLSCSESDHQGSPTFVGSAPNNPDLHLARGSLGIGLGTAATSPTTDIDGDARPRGFTSDVGADQREPASIGTTKIGAVAIGESEADVSAFYGPPRHSRSLRQGAKRLRLSVYRLHRGRLWVAYSEGAVSLVGTTSSFYEASDGLRVGKPVAAALQSTLTSLLACGRHYRRGGGSTYQAVFTHRRGTPKVFAVEVIKRGFHPVCP